MSLRGEGNGEQSDDFEVVREVKLLKSIKAPQMGMFFALDAFIYEMRRANTRQESWRIKLVSLGVHGETFSLIGVV